MPHDPGSPAPAPAFDTILIANRGEIACRVIAAAKSLGYATVAVYSDADRDARHVALADRAVRLGPPAVGESYLSVERVLDAARTSGANAVHPGYGFLSENADFADACAAAGLTFIGPPAAAIRAMGNKAAAKRLMIDAGVPCVPGYQDPVQDDAALVAAADGIGFPIMVKAAAGGGGRGMRLVEDAAALPAAITDARREARGAFGSDELILERAVIRPRHVEIQVMGDAHGNIIHLGERDCSVQRRHQKVIEEAPCPVLTDATRDAMGAAAVRAAAAIDYRGAGTVEFLLGPSGEFFFLEMNTRIQVEHPVTEMVTGLDLVAMQINVAAGRPLPLRQEDVRLHGHAIEARLYAEDPANDFLPQTGDIRLLDFPAGDGVRVDHGLTPGGTVSPFYDPMLAKLIAHGPTREDARPRLIRALGDLTLLGVTTNRDFLRDILRDDVFAAGDATTDFIATRFPDLTGADDGEVALLTAMAAVLLIATDAPRGELANWWSTGASRHALRLAPGRADGRRLEVIWHDDGYRVVAGDDETAIAVERLDRDTAVLRVNGGLTRVRFVRDADGIDVDDGETALRVADVTYAPPQVAAPGADGMMRAPMNGAIVAVEVAEGAAVKVGDTLVVMEAMKMSQPIVAPVDGTVKLLAVAVGDQVATRQLLVEITPNETEVSE